jgi:hypothetical protein
MIGDVGLPLLLMTVGASCLFGIVLGPVYWLLSKPVIGKRIEYGSGLIAAVVGLAASTTLLMGSVMAVSSANLDPLVARSIAFVLPIPALTVTNFMLVRTNDRHRITLKQAFALQVVPVVGALLLALFAYRSPF